MARFDRYMLSQLMVLFGFFALVLVLVYWINRAVGLFDQLIADGQSALVFLEFTALSLPNLIRVVLPVAAFSSVLYVTNRMTSEAELTVIQATGYSALRLARPVLYFAVLVAVMMAILTNTLSPAAASRLALREAEVSENVTARLLREGVFSTPSKGTTFYVRDLTDQGELQDVFLSDTTSPTESTIYTAERAFLVKSETGPKLVMIDGLAQILRYSDQNLITTTFNDAVFDIGALDGNQFSGRRNLKELSTQELLNPTVALMVETRKDAGSFANEGHARLAQPFLAIASALLGFAMLMSGGFSRFGIWRQILAAIVLLVLLKIGEGVVADVIQGNAQLWPLTYLPFAIGIALAYGMLWNSGRIRRSPPAKWVVPL